MKMQLDVVGPRSYDLPPIEQDVSELTIEQIMEKTREFWHRFEKASLINDDAEFTPMYFLQLLTFYPVSMCKRHMSDTLKLLIAMSYYANKPKETDKNPIWNGHSYEDLSLIFVRSKASIHSAIRDKKIEAKDSLTDIELRKEAKKIALSQLIIEEKAKLRGKNDEMPEGIAKQPNERAILSV